MSAEQRRPACQQGTESLDALSRCSADAQDRVACSLIHFTPEAKQVFILFAKGVALVDGDDGRHMVGFAGDQKAIDESHGCARVAEGGHEERLVEVGSNDVMSLTAGGRDPVYIIASVVNAGDDPTGLLACFLLNIDHITDRNGVGGGDAVQLEAALHARLYELSGIILEDIPAAGRFIHACGHGAS